MKRLLVLVGLLGAAAVAVARRFGLGKSTTEGAAETVGEGGPGVTGSAAQDIEEAERGAEEVRQPAPDAQEEEEQEKARDEGGEPSEVEEAPR